MLSVLRELSRLIFKLFLIFLIKVIDFHIPFNMREELLRIIRVFHNLNDLHHDLKYLEIRPPALLAQVLESNFVLSVGLDVLLYVQMHYFMMEVALQRLFWVSVWDVDVYLVFVVLIRGVFWTIYDYGYLLQEFEVIGQYFV